MGFFERLLNKLFPHTDIFRDGTNDIYLRRWFIYPRDKDFGKNVSKGRIYLHKFYKGDEDWHLHDHPWSFTSFILTRGYWEETFFNPNEPLGKNWRPGEISPDEFRIQRFYPRFSVLKRPATWKHRVVLKDKVPVWTIIKTGVKERGWGFWVMGKLCPWRNYDSGVCWCSPEEKQENRLDKNVPSTVQMQ